MMASVNLTASLVEGEEVSELDGFTFLRLYQKQAAIEEKAMILAARKACQMN